MKIFDSDFNLYIFTCDSCSKLLESKESHLPDTWYEFDFKLKTNHACSKYCAETVLANDYIKNL